ncbi:hypothetical protein [Polyangium aurulentum]|uniref:hypothetical protein n=1 Tax=Polyangium aurulentum TaxID=2567896 RepID=UPI00197EE947|nr:hypothetical protein [Polyangium aurulentum]UQA62265.1 hypothetical protein E8A73_018045 [Polyangium aurulentum]
MKSRVAAALGLVAVAAPAPVALAADAPAAPSAAPSTAPAAPHSGWVAELDNLSRYLTEHRADARCPDHCYVLERLRLTGAVGDGPLEFELVGRVLANEPVAVPLFGPPKDVRLEGVTENDKEAAIGFDGDHYFLHTGAKRFVLRGKIHLGSDLALVVPGPLNTLEGDVSSGAVVEGSRLSGLVATTIHLSREGKGEKAAGPTVFQLSRAVRVGREISFEYRLVMRSGADLGVVRLPLTMEEKVLDVTGASGFRVENGELVLSTSGRTAEMTITGTLPKLGAFAPDSRSSYEWLLVESDPEHRVTVTGDARQVDSAESPIPRAQATSRLFLVQKGQRMEASVTPLVGVEALSAVVRSHRRTMVVTPRGDLVSDDSLLYENNGIDYLAYAPSGRPIFLATGGKAERIMRQASGAEEVLVPLRTGSHDVRVQSLGQADLRQFGGTIALPMPSYALTSSRVDLTVGLPAGVVPLALLGGDRPAWAFDSGDVVAATLGFGVGAAAVRQGPEADRRRVRRLRILAGVLLAALWFLWEPGFVVAVAALGIWGMLWLLGRFVQGPLRTAITVLLVGALGFVGLIGVVTLGSRSMKSADMAYEESAWRQPPSQTAPAPSTAAGGGGKLDDRTGNFLPGKGGGVLEGVTPVALPLPGYSRSMSASRELVTRDRPFMPKLVYVTNLAIAPFAFLWLVGLGLVLSAHRAQIGEAYRRIRARLDKPETPTPQAPKIIG